MTSNDAVGLLAFLALFEILGGGAIGLFLRGVLAKQVNGANLFFLIWGAGFAGIPLCVGAALFASSGQFAFFGAQVFLLVVTVALVAAVPGDILAVGPGRAMYGSLALGLVGLLFGGGLVFLAAQHGNWIMAGVGGILGFAGAVMCLRGVVAVVRAE